MKLAGLSSKPSKIPNQKSLPREEEGRKEGRMKKLVDKPPNGEQRDIQRSPHLY